MKRVINNVVNRAAGFLAAIGIVTFLLSSCKEETHQPMVPGVQPSELTDIHVENRKGAAIISYSLPDQGAFYVVAEYESRPGVKRQVKSSVYKQELLLAGFEKAGKYNVTLYVVGRDEQRSDAVEVVVNPLTPPYLETFNSLEVFEDWGGVSIRANNDEESDLMFGVFALDEDGQPQGTAAHYTKQADVEFAVRGFESKNIKFGFFVRDKWENHSDTLYHELTPLYEIELDRSKFSEVRLPTDTYTGHNIINTPMHGMWNDVTSNRDNVFLTLPNLSPIPQWFTFDMNSSAKLSRMRIWHRATFLFDAGNLKRFEVYGSNNPNPDGSWESWELLGTFESKKPSGLPVGQNSNEDVEYINAGEEFVFGLDTPPVRYLRVKTLEVWGGVSYISIQMMKVWGQPVE